MSSVAPSVRLSVTLYIVAKRYTLQWKYPNKWIGRAFIEDDFMVLTATVAIVYY